MILDAKNLIAGRLAAYAAKQALLGEKVDIINSEKAVISGKKADIFAKFAHKMARGTQAKGPFQPRVSYLLLKRMIRGMLPHRHGKGITAYKNIRCYVGVPKEFEGKKTEDVKKLHKSRLFSARTITVEQLSIHLGRK